MTARPDQDRSTAAEGAALAALLAERAGAVRPRGTTPGNLVRRAERVRHRRRSAAVGVGLVATSAVAALVVSRPPGDEPQVEAGWASGAAPSGTIADPDGPPASDPADGLVDPASPNVFLATEPPVGAPASGPPLRLGLGAPGAVVTSVDDFPEGDADPGPPPLVSGVRLVDASGAAVITVSVFFTNGSIPPIQSASAGGVPVDVGDGATGALTRWPAAPDGVASPPIELGFERGGASVALTGVGATDEQLIGVARAISIHPNPAILLGWIPEGLTPVAADDTLIGWGGGLRSSMAYRLASGDQITIGITSRPSGSFPDEVAAVGAAPTADTFLHPVRGTQAIVRSAGRAGTSSVTWLEPSGHLVSVLIDTVPSGATAPDLSVLDHLVEVDEATFQSMVTTRVPG